MEVSKANLCWKVTFGILKVSFCHEAKNWMTIPHSGISPLEDHGWKVVAPLDEDVPSWKAVLEGLIENLEQVLELGCIWPVFCPKHNHHRLLEGVEPLSAS